MYFVFLDVVIKQHFTIWAFDILQVSYFHPAIGIPLLQYLQCNIVFSDLMGSYGDFMGFIVILLDFMVI